MPRDPEKLRAKQARSRARRREKISAYNHAHYLSHIEEIRLANRERYLANQDDRLDRAAAYRATHPEEIRISKATHRLANLDEYRAKAKAKWAADPVKSKTLNAARYQRNRPAILLMAAIKRASQPAKVRARQQRYRANHPERNAYDHELRKARKNGATIIDFCPAQWEEMLLACHGQCVYCGRDDLPLTKDHLTPYARGGNHTLWNILPACVSCNCKKKDGPPLCPVQPLLLTIANPRRPRKKRVA